jgi:hypothetical protein
MQHACRSAFSEQTKLVIKHTFLEFQSIEEEGESPKLRRHKSDPAFTSIQHCEQVTKILPYDKLNCKLEEPLTPTTCASVNGDEDDATPSSPFSIDEDDARGKFSFSSTVIGELSAPTMPMQNATLESTAAVWPQLFDSFALLSTSPTATQAKHSAGLVYDSWIQDQTTLMVRNLPTDLSQPGLVQSFIDAGYCGMFDFVYMPMNFRGQGNFGYAFVNFVSNEVAAHVMDQMRQREDDDLLNLERWTSAWSSCQGLDDNIQRYRNSPLMHDSVPLDCKPALYDASGTQIAFPKPTKTLSKPRIHWPNGKDGKKVPDVDPNLDTRFRQGGSMADGPRAASCNQLRPGRSQKTQRRQATLQATNFTTRCASSR